MATRMSDFSAQVGGVKAEKRTLKRRARVIAPAAMVLLLTGLFLCSGFQRKARECMARCACMPDGCRANERPGVEHECGQCSGLSEPAHNPQA